MNKFSKANHTTPINTVKPQHLFVAFRCSVDSKKEAYLDTKPTFLLHRHPVEHIYCSIFVIIILIMGIKCHQNTDTLNLSGLTSKFTLSPHMYLYTYLIDL